jgi:hypothetical protein
LYANLPKLQQFKYKAPDTDSVLQEYLWKYHVHLGEVAYIYSFNTYVRSLGYRERLKVIQHTIIENKTGYLLEHAKILKTYLQELYVQIFTLNQEGFTRELDETNRQHSQLLEVYNEIEKNKLFKIEPKLQAMSSQFSSRCSNQGTEQKEDILFTNEENYNDIISEINEIITLNEPSSLNYENEYEEINVDDI